MILGTLLDALEDEGYAAGALDAIGDVVLLAQVHAMRELHDETPGEYVANASRRFATRATDEDWLALMNTMERADRPGRAAIAPWPTAYCCNQTDGRPLDTVPPRGSPCHA